MDENGDWNRGPMKKSFSAPLIIVLLNVFNTITHILIGGVFSVALIFLSLGSYSNHFNQHVLLCSLGYFVLMSEAILSIDPRNGWTNGLQLKERRVAHWLVQIAGSTLAITGSAIRIQGVGGNFATTHSILGLVALILTCISLVGGLVNLFHMELRLPAHLIRICHAIIGAGAYVCANVSLIYGFDKAMFRNTFDDTTTNTIIGFICVVTVGTLVSTCKGVIQRLMIR